jgi:hypothetical protein
MKTETLTSISDLISTTKWQHYLNAPRSSAGVPGTYYTLCANEPETVTPTLQLHARLCPDCQRALLNGAWTNR